MSKRGKCKRELDSKRHGSGRNAISRNWQGSNRSKPMLDGNNLDSSKSDIKNYNQKTIAECNHQQVKGLTFREVVQGKKLPKEHKTLRNVKVPQNLLSRHVEHHRLASNKQGKKNSDNGV